MPLHGALHDGHDMRKAVTNVNDENAFSQIALIVGAVDVLIGRWQVEVGDKASDGRSAVGDEVVLFEDDLVVVLRHVR